MKYKHLFFDLDHTLWDFERSSKETLLELYFEHDIGMHGNVSEDDYIEVFRVVNRELWSKYNESLVDKAYIRDRRFFMMFDKLGIDASLLPSNLGELYLFKCPQKPHLLPYSLEALNHLSANYHLHILTNGFDDVQSIKLQSSGIQHYFQTVVTSESTGHKKPSPEIFEYALAQAEADLSESLMIGDNLDTDIEGALRFGMDAVFYNPGNIYHKKKPRYEIRCLKELRQML